MEAGQFTRDYSSMPHWELYFEELLGEYRQCLDEGKDVEKYEGLFKEIAKLPRSAQKEAMADALFQLLCETEQRADYSYIEPCDLEEIKAQKPQSAPLCAPCAPDEDKIRGAWVGRIAGCLLGKPIEGISFTDLTKLLKLTDNYPMTRYIYQKELTDEIAGQVKYRLSDRCWADTLDSAPIDDDTNYTVLGTLVTERYGRGFTSADIGEMWLYAQCKYAYCTAERVAYLNLINGLKPPCSAQYKNPYRELIGAQIRGDWFGYINPGDPIAAADMAFRDASVSHIKNGIYGEMFVAAALAGAACLSEVKDVVLCGLSQIPRNSRLYIALFEVVARFDGGMSADAWFSDFHTRYDDKNSYDWCHTVSNAEIVTAALLWGDGDYAKSVGLSVMQGFDTDCNGATVGSIVGMMKGINAIDPAWFAPWKGILNTSIHLAPRVTVDELVKRTLAAVKN